MPKALYFWGLAAFFLNWMLVMFQHVSLWFAVGLLFLCILGTLTKTAGLCRNPFHSFFGRADSTETSVV